MPWLETWIPTGPPLTIEALYAQGGHQNFLYNSRLYRGFLPPAPVPQGQDLLYGAIAIAHGTPTTSLFRGSTVVIPVRAELPPYSPGP